MSTDHLKKLSKSLSYVLRHRPDSVGLDLAAGGWIRVDELLSALSASGRPLSLELLQQIVAKNGKQRFEFGGDGSLIRAR